MYYNIVPENKIDQKSNGILSKLTTSPILMSKATKSVIENRVKNVWLSFMKKYEEEKNK